MKKVISILLVIVMLCSIFAGLQITSSALEASGSCGENVTYNFNIVNDMGILTVMGSGDMDDYAYEDSPFYNNSEINIVYILNGVTSVGKYAFHKCSKLQAVVFSDSVTKINDYAFFNCKGLKLFTLSAGITSIGKDAFTYCSALESISVDTNNTVYDSRDNCNAVIRTDDNTLIIGSNNTVIPDSVTAIGPSAFSAYPISTITIPDSVLTIEKGAFMYCRSLSNITLSKNLTEIGETVFYGCEKLENITIPDGVTSIGNMAFSNCDKLKNIELPDSVTALGNYAFYACFTLENVKLSDNLTSIGSCTFDGCSSLKSIVIPDSVTSIGNYAFKGCSGLEELTMPCSAKIYNSADTFSGCSNIKKLTMTKGTGTMQNYSLTNTSTDSGDTCVNNTPWHISKAALKEIVIKDGVTNIGNYVFYDCYMVTSVSLPDSVTTINEYAFAYCSNLPALTLPKHLTSIGDFAFYSCGLKSVALPNTVSSIGIYAFAESSIESFKFSAAMTSIPFYVFANCRELGSVFVPESITTIEPNAFHNTIVRDIYYASTQEQWNLIDIDESNRFTYVTIHYQHPTHSYELAEEVEATCTHSGYTLYRCECGHTYITNITPMIEHSYVKTVIEPTTESQGYTVHTCSVCGYSYVDSITDVLPSSMNYIIPSLAQIQTTLIMKSAENEYTVTSSNGVFEIENIIADTYRVYAKQKNSLTIYIDEFSAESEDVVNDNVITMPLGDVNDDDVIDIADLSMLLATGNYGNANTEIDLTGDGLITIDDISLVLKATNFGMSSAKIV